MAPTPKIYNATLKEPAESVEFHLDTGELKQYNVYQEVGTAKHLVRCDICGLFLPLKGRSAILLQQYRGKGECQKIVKRNSKPKPGLFIPTTFPPENVPLTYQGK